MTIRKDSFKVRFHSDADLEGAKSWLAKDSKTIDRSQVGKICLIGGRIFLTALKNWIIRESLAHLPLVVAKIATTCTLSVLSPRPKSRPVCKNSRSWEEDGKSGLKLLPLAKDLNLFQTLSCILFVDGFFALSRVEIILEEHSKDWNLCLSTANRPILSP